jgi:uncharacterized protein (DUF1330 family)
MSAYFIFVRDRLKDPAGYEAYGQKARESFAGRDFKLLALHGAVTPLEGLDADGVVIIEFPSVEAAKDWYESPAYQAAVGGRLASTEGRALIVEGM